MPLVALGYVTRFATGLFSLGRKQSDSKYLDENGTESLDTREVLDKETSREEHDHVKPDVLDGHVAETEDAESSVPVGMDIDGAGAENYYTFRHFDITQNPFDHYFLHSSAQVS